MQCFHESNHYVTFGVVVTLLLFQFVPWGPEDSLWDRMVGFVIASLVFAGVAWCVVAAVRAILKRTQSHLVGEEAPRE